MDIQCILIINLDDTLTIAENLRGMKMGGPKSLEICPGLAAVKGAGIASGYD